MAWHDDIGAEVAQEFARLVVWDWPEGWRAFVPRETTCITVLGLKLREAAEESGLDRKTILLRRERGMSAHDAVRVEKCPSKGIERRRWIEARRAEGRAA